MNEESLQKLRDEGIMLQQDGERYVFRLCVSGGYMQGATLAEVAKLADQFGNGYVHLTTRQGIEIPDVSAENIPSLREALLQVGQETGGTGRRVRTIVACPGTRCRYGTVNVQDLARRIRKAVRHRDGLPHKFKIAASGCPNSCAKPTENDLGLMGVGKGQCQVFVGGKMGRCPRRADKLEGTVSAQGAHDLIGSVLDWYVEHGRPKERFGTVIDRVGLNALCGTLSEAGFDLTSPV